MKKFVLILLIALSLSPLYAFSFYYGAGGIGEASVDDHYAGLSMDIGFSVFDEPYLMVDGEIVLSPLFEGVSINVSTSPFSVVTDTFLFANPVLYSPKIQIGAEYMMDSGWRYRAELALINFRDTKFAYEFLTSVIIVDMLDYDIGYGVRLMKFTYFI